MATASLSRADDQQRVSSGVLGILNSAADPVFVE